MLVRPVTEIRRDNLHRLIAEAGNASKLSALTGVPQPYISQVSRAVPHSTTGQPREMGDDIARKLEVKMGKPRGWMDVDHSALAMASDLNGREGQLVGLFRLLSDVEQIDLVNELTSKLRRAQPPADPAAASRPVQH